jgi:ABC-2 type transport system permease protein
MPTTDLVRLDLARLDLRLRRRSLIGYAVGMAVYTLVVVALYPAFKDDAGLDKLSQESPEVAALFGASGPLTTPSGWLDANLYANFVPLVALLLTIGYGAWCIAGQDEDLTLAGLATLPVSRRSLLLQKFLVLCAQAVPVTAAVTACVVLGREFELPVGTAGLAGVTGGVLLLAVDFGALALLVGCLTGSRGVALAIASAVAAAAYLLSSLAPVVDWLHPARWASPFYWAVGNGQVADGLTLGELGALVGLGAVLLGGSLIAFERLDLH